MAHKDNLTSDSPLKGTTNWLSDMQTNKDIADKMIDLEMQEAATTEQDAGAGGSVS